MVEFSLLHGLFVLLTNTNLPYCIIKQPLIQTVPFHLYYKYTFVSEMTFLDQLFTVVPHAQLAASHAED